MTAKMSIDDVIDKIVTYNDPSELLQMIRHYLLTTDYTFEDEIYWEFIEKMDIDSIKRRLPGIIMGLINNETKINGIGNWISDKLINFKDSIRSLDSHDELLTIIHKIHDTIGDVYYRDEPLRRLIINQDIEKTKEVFTNLIKKGS